MGSADPLATTALVVSFVALFTTFIQVLQQFFATAEGYRRCLPSVMGPWGKMTHKRWRWMEFRYETLYTTPEFCLTDSPVFVHSSVQARQGSQFVKITGDEDSTKSTLTPPRSPHLKSNEQVCWIKFLQALHEKSRDAIGVEQGNHNIISLPALRCHERSWDFMPPDVVRPLASSNISDICILVRRLGLIWKDCRPYEGGMRAEGSGHVITSTMMRGVGLVLDYTYLGTIDPTENYRNIWKLEADKMGFGILPGNPDFSIPDFVIGTNEDVLARLSEFDRTDGARNKVKKELDKTSFWTVAFPDLIPLAAPMLRIRGSSTIRIPSPTVYNTGLTKHYEGFKAFHYQLEQMVNNGNQSEQLKGVLEQYEGLRREYGEKWENDTDVESKAGRRSIAFLNAVQTCYDGTTAYFKELENNSRFRYLDLVKVHVAHAVFYHEDAMDNIRNGSGRTHFHFSDHGAVEGMHLYFDYLDKYVQAMAKVGYNDGASVKDAWVTLMFRAFCWQRCHLMVDGLTVPSQYYGSQQPIYIG